MTADKYKNRLFGRTRGRSKKKIDLKNYFSLLKKYKIPTIDPNKNYILENGSENFECILLSSLLT